MPMTKKGRDIMAAMKKEYGPKRGEQVFYASKNKGTIRGVERMMGGGMVHSSASRRADGIAQKGKTKGRVI